LTTHGVIDTQHSQKNSDYVTNSINRSTFVMRAECVFCGEGTGFLH